MKQKETLLNSQLFTENENEAEVEELGDNHIGTSYETPLKEDAFQKDYEYKKERIKYHFSEIMKLLGLDLNDDSLNGTPERVAEMYLNELFSGLDPENKPEVKLFDNRYKYDEMLIEKNITFFSSCEHHFVPIKGKAHVAYISKGKVIGLSKINRIVQYYARRPQVQERLTVQVANELKYLLQTDDIAVILDAEHLCVSSRGIKDTSSSTVTSQYYGKFKDKKIKEELMHYLDMDKIY